MIARYHIRSGNIGPKATLSDLFDDTNVMAVIDLPGRIAVLAEKTASLGLSVKSMLLRNTLFCYYTSFQSKSVIKYVEQWAFDRRSKAPHMKLGIMAGAIKLPQYLRYCPKCVAEDRINIGESYWRRIHQTPGVLVCSKHGCLLQDSNLRYASSRTNQFFAAEDYVQTTETVTYKLTDKEYVKACQFASDVQWLNQHYDQIYNAFKRFGDFRFLYLRYLVEKGLATESGRLHISELISNFRSFFGENLLSLWQSNIDYTDNNNWLISICRKNRKSFHPLRHILMAEFLCDSLETLITDILCRCKPIAKKAELNLKAECIQDSVRSKNRAKWLECCDQNLTFKKTQIRKLSPDSYIWLYRHDREWLNSHSPISVKEKPINKRVDWQLRDIEMRTKIQKYVITMLKSTDKPHRICVSRIGKELGCSDLLQKHLDKMPETKAYINLASDTADNYNTRKIKWAMAQLQNSGEKLAMWKALRLAGIRYDNWDKYLV